MRDATTFLKLSVLLGGLASAVLLTNCGGGGGTRGGTGGSTGGGTGGGTGAGGSNNGSLDCTNALQPYAGGVVTDFTDFNGTSGKWGTLGMLRGSRFAFGDGPALPDGGAKPSQAANIEATPPSTDLNLHLTLTAVPGGYAGGGASFDSCVTAAAFTSISFTVAGSITPACPWQVQLQTFSQRPTSQNPPGGCTAASCYNFPAGAISVQPTADKQTVVVPFTALSSWTAPMAAELVGLQWQINSPPGADGGAQPTCAIDLHIDDIKFQ